MDTLESLGRRMATTQDLRSIVRTMKSLSAVSIRQYEQAVTALRDYDRTLALGLQAVLRTGRPPDADAERTPAATVAIVFGSDHGLCGRFNQQISAFARAQVRARVPGARANYLTVGGRASAHLEAEGERVAGEFRLPAAVGGLTAMARSILLDLDARRSRGEADRVLLFHNTRPDGGSAEPRGIQLLPLDGRWLRRLAERPWRSRSLPTFTIAAADLLAALVRQHLFVGLFRAGAESAASEHATRLAAMQAAERNIDEHLEEMASTYRRKRQEFITEELLDVVAGFEVLTAAP